MFNVHQLQPRVLAGLNSRAWAHWLKDCFHLSFREMIEQHGASVAVVGYDLDYLSPFTFRDGDGLRVEASLRMRRDGKLMQQETLCRGPQGLVARMVSSHSLTATRDPLPDALLARLQPEEWVDSFPVPNSSLELPALEAGRALPGGRRAPFTLHRHQCDVADQWSFTEVVSLGTQAREELVLAAKAEAPEALVGLSQPVRRVAVELRRPFFAFESGEVHSQAYATDGGVAFVHRLMAGAEMRGLIIEQF